MAEPTGSLGGEIAIAVLLGVAAAAAVWPRRRPLAHTSMGPHTVWDVCADRERCVSPMGQGGTAATGWSSVTLLRCVR